MLRVDAGEVNAALSLARERVARADRRALAECLLTCRFHLSPFRAKDDEMDSFSNPGTRSESENAN